jgi:hypothetical protein
MGVDHNTVLEDRDFFRYLVSMTILQTDTLVAAKSTRRLLQEMINRIESALAPCSSRIEPKYQHRIAELGVSIFPVSLPAQ